MNPLLGDLHEEVTRFAINHLTRDIRMPISRMRGGPHRLLSRPVVVVHLGVVALEVMVLEVTEVVVVPATPLEVPDTLWAEGPMGS